MKNIPNFSILVCVAVLAAALPARAQDTIFLKEAGKKQLAGRIAVESPQGVKLKNQDVLIPAESIRDIEYEAPDADVRIKVTRPAYIAEAAFRSEADDKKRLPKLEAALAKYESALGKLADKKSFLFRHFVFKIAALGALKADLVGTESERIGAIDKLKKFTAQHPKSWQLIQALTILARLQVEQKDFAGAEDTLKALSEAPISQAARQEADLTAAQLSMKTGKYEEARKKLEAVAAKLPPDSPAAQKARLAQAECLAATKNTAAARQLLQGLLDKAADPQVKAVAYNTLGFCHFQDNQMKEARWAFLWVDMVYNQNKAEHAKALYYLHHVFARLNDERAREYLDALLNDQQLTGQEYQRRAIEERKK
jgi:hypothetical protein